MEARSRTAVRGKREATGSCGVLLWSARWGFGSSNFRGGRTQTHRAADAQSGRAKLESLPPHSPPESPDKVNAAGRARKTTTTTTTNMRSVSALWRTIGMVVTVAFMSACGASEYEYMSWKPEITGPIYGKTPQCVGIPEDLRLCHGVGYPEMLLPNLLEHETMAEVKQQASSWVPLVHKRCHPGTQVFLCSLFAPVCLDRPIYPCRRLCEAVRDGCTPIMEAFGYPWPEMLTCDKFPEHDVCISMTPNVTEAPETTGSSPICPPCDNEMKTDTMLEHMCASEFAIKTKIKEVKRENADRKVLLQKRKKLIKQGNLKKKDLKKLVLYLKNGADCPCQQLDNTANQYLIMGRKVDKQYLLTGIHKWDKSNTEFKKAMKTLKTHQCPEFVNVFK